MKKYFVLGMVLMSTFAHAHLYIENGGRVYFNEIECLNSDIDKGSILCKQHNEFMICSVLFSARLTSGETEILQLNSETQISSDSKLWKKLSFGITDKLNASTAKVEARFDLKSKLKEFEEIRRCDANDV